ncbi:acetolactate synthase 3 large subunit [Umboniibacter marinipuniceus]|nr:acetolactate synthase 3 large subunit [Umboniibacter marinipuniceus]
MEMLNGGDMLVKSLQNEGVEVIFGYPGGSALHIYDAIFRQDKIEHVLVRHEQAATHAADGFARTTGKPGVVLVTSGPGATNAITGIATAYMDSIPMVVISGQVQSHLIGDDAFQETDMVGVSRPIVKHSFLVTKTEDIPETIKKAFYIASSGRPGPVVVDIPKDMCHPDKTYPFEYPAEVKMRSYNPIQKGHLGQIRKAVKLLKAAKRPVIYSGGGVVLGEASAELTELARLCGAPVTNTLMGLGAFPGNDEQFIGMLGMHGTVEANNAMHHADLIFAVGARFDDRVTNTPDKFCPFAKIVHIDIDPASISKTVTADVPIVGPVKSVLTDAIDIYQNTELEQVDLTDWWARIEKWRSQYSIYRQPNYDQQADGPIKPQEVIKALYKATNGDAIVTSDVGQHQMFAAQYYQFKEPRQWVNSGGLGTMGFGLPAGMGAKLAHPERDIAVVTGEGSIQMNIQELATCTHYNLPVKIINLNNSALGMVRQWQDMQYAGRYSASTYADSLPDFIALARAYGHDGIRVEKLEDLAPALEWAFSQKDKLIFVDVVVDQSEHVYPMQIMPNGSMQDMWISKTERT